MLVLHHLQIFCNPSMSKLRNATDKILLFRNAHYGESEDNQAVLPIRDLSDLLVTNYPGHSPVIRFDGVAGIQMNNVGFVLLVDFQLTKTLSCR